MGGGGGGKLRMFGACKPIPKFRMKKACTPPLPPDYCGFMVYGFLPEYHPPPNLLGPPPPQITKMKTFVTPPPPCLSPPPTIVGRRPTFVLCYIFITISCLSLNTNWLFYEHPWPTLKYLRVGHGTSL